MLPMRPISFGVIRTWRINWIWPFRIQMSITAWASGPAPRRPTRRTTVSGPIRPRSLFKRTPTVSYNLIFSIIPLLLRHRFFYRAVQGAGRGAGQFPGGQSDRGTFDNDSLVPVARCLWEWALTWIPRRHVRLSGSILVIRKLRMIFFSALSIFLLFFKKRKERE